MHSRSPQLFETVRDAGAFIQEVTQGVTLERYVADRLLRQAVERNFEIIGEAIKRLAVADAPFLRQPTPHNVNTNPSTSAAGVVTDTRPLQP